MRALWEGSEGEFYDDLNQNQWSKLELSPGDCVVSLLPTSYQLAVLPSLGDYVSTTVDVIGIGNHIQFFTGLRALGAHPRIRETLGCGFSMMRATLLQKWISGGDKELEKLDSQANELPKKNTRNRITDEELRMMISEAPTEVKSSITRIVHWVRHKKNISASYSRIISALKSCK